MSDVVVITGASGGIGRATARRFARAARRSRCSPAARPDSRPRRGDHGWDVHVTMVRLAGFNTTQFTWGRTKLPRQTQPVPPIYQPEVAADAIHWAAYHRRRQVYVGLPTVLNVLGERVAPGFLDWYLAKTGYGSQMTKEPLDGGPNHDNLYEPVDGEADHRAHGPFDEEAHARSFQTTLTKHRRLAGSLAAGVGAAATGAALLRKR